MFSQSTKSADPQAHAQTRQGAPTPTPTPTPAPGRTTGEPSIISADLRVVGDLHCSGDLQVNGNVEGDIKSQSVSIGEGAHVQGSVVADTVHISGTIRGQIEAPAVTVAKSGKVIGDIMHQTLAVEAGAYLEGNCRRLEAKKTAEPAGVSSLKPPKTETAEAEKKAAGAS
ncbi:MAG: polymer-forming cytoskeletal protein [Kiloniellaceae bacterium]